MAERSRRFKLPRRRLSRRFRTEWTAWLESTRRGGSWIIQTIDLPTQCWDRMDIHPHFRAEEGSHVRLAEMSREGQMAKHALHIY
jgi:hypothetical protein